MIPFVLWALQASLTSPASFDALQLALTCIPAKLVMWVIMAGLIYHFVAGIKHLLIDMGIGETIEGAQRMAYIVLGSSALLMIAAGVWIW